MLSKERVSLILIFIPLLTSFILGTEFTEVFIIPKQIYTSITLSLLVSLILFNRLSSKKKTKVELNILDVSIISFLLYEIIRLFFTKNTILTNAFLLEELLLTAYYFVTKALFKRTEQPNNHFFNTFALLINILLIILLTQGFLQLLNLIPTHQDISSYRVTGTFGNPGPYSNFIVSLLPFSLYGFLFSKKERYLKYSSILVILLCTGILPFSNGRTAWIAYFFIVGGMLVLKYNLISYLRNHLNLKLRFFVGVLGLIILLGAGYWLFTYKLDSSNGRIFILKSSLELIKEKPLFGHGFDAFNIVHNKKQADYFSTNPNAPEVYIAADSTYAFNEFVQTSVNYGIIGLILLTIIFVLSLFKLKSNNTMYTSFKIGLIAYLIIMLLSYPFRIATTHTVLYLLLGGISATSTKNLFEYNLNKGTQRIISVVGISLFISIFIIEVKRLNAEKEWLSTFKEVKRNNLNALKNYEKIKDVMSYNKYFLLNYGSELAVAEQYDKAIEVLNLSENTINEPNLYMYRGYSYAGLNKLDLAEKDMRMAINLEPLKLYPRYQLVTILDKAKKYEEAKKEANNILQMKTKIDNNITKIIKSKMSKYLEDQTL